MDDKITQDSMSETEIERILQRVGPRLDPPVDLMQEVKAKVKQAWHEEVQQQQLRQKRRQQQWLGMAAAIVMLVGAGIFFGSTPRAEDVAKLTRTVQPIEYRRQGGDWTPLEVASSTELAASGIILSAGMEIRSGANNYAGFELNNGMRVRMDQQTQLLFKSADEIYLQQGAIYAESTGPESILVTTPFGSAKDIGTRFEVRLMPDAWQVQVRDGKVQVDGAANHVLAVAGQRVSINRDDQVITSLLAANDTSWSWTQEVAEPFKIEGARLTDYLAWWSSETGQAVVFKSHDSEDAAKTTILHGSIDGLSPDESLDALLASTHFIVVDRSENKVTFDQAP